MLDPERRASAVRFARDQGMEWRSTIFVIAEAAIRNLYRHTGPNTPEGKQASKVLMEIADILDEASNPEAGGSMGFYSRRSGQVAEGPWYPGKNTGGGAPWA
jgi:hypothetical protein